MKPRISTRCLAAVAIACMAPAAFAQLPNRFVNGEVADADQVNANFDHLVGEIAARDTRIAELEAEVATLKGQVATHDGFEARIAALEAASFESRVATLEGVLTTENQALLTDLLPHMSVVEMSQIHPNGSTAKTVRFSGVNVQIRNDRSVTDSPDGTGNLILGHAESEALTPSFEGRTGSHNLVIGTNHTYSGCGGIIAGVQHSLFHNYGALIGGQENQAIKARAVVVGGTRNIAGLIGGAPGTWNYDGKDMVIVGGEDNRADSQSSVVVGGKDNKTAGLQAVAVGGRWNYASGISSGTFGGGGEVEFNSKNTASGNYSTVTGGRKNTASGPYSSVSGGWDEEASSEYDWRAGDTLFSDQ